MKNYILFISIACFVYGIWAVVTSKLFTKDIKLITEKYKQLYAKLCGVALLIVSSTMGIFYYLVREELLYSVVRQPVLLIGGFILVLMPVAIIAIAKKALREKGKNKYKSGS